MVTARRWEPELDPRPDGALLLIRVWLSDRPGALGQVASRIGAMRGDIVGVDVLERGETVAVDEFCVALVDGDHIDLLIREIEEVDGASVEEWRVVDRFPDPRLDALVSADRLCHATTRGEVLDVLALDARDEFNADWTAILLPDTIAAAAGDDTPDARVLSALAAGTNASPMVREGRTGPDDLAVAPLTTIDATLLAGREGHPFRRRERQQLLALARIADRVLDLLERE